MKKKLLIILVSFAALCPVSQAQTTYSETVSNDAPVLYWNFDESTGNAHEVMPVLPADSVRNLVPYVTATRISHASIGDGLNLGNAADLLLGDYFMVNNLTLPTNALRGAWMLEFWMRVQGSQEFLRNNYLMNFGAGGGNLPAVLYDYVGSAQSRFGLELYSGYGGGERTGAGPTVTDENWHHVLFAYYGNGTNGVADQVDVFVDGTNAAQNVRANFFSSTNAALVLSRFVVGTSAPQFAGFDGFEGNLDEVALYDLSTFTNQLQVATHASEVASNHFALAHTANSYAQGVLADDPLVYWNFDEESGDAVQLATVIMPPNPNQNDLTALNGADRISHSVSGSGLALGNAASIPVGGYFTINQIFGPAATVPAPWILEFWMQVQGSQDAQRNDYLINFGANAPAVFYDYVGGAQPRNGLELYSGGRSGAGPLVEDTSWHHVLFAYYGDGGSGVADRLDVYLDGTNAAENVRATFASSINLSSLSVGTSGAQFAVADGFEGNLDELALYNLAGLTEAEMTTKAADLAARHFAAAQQPSLAAVAANGQLTLSWNSSATGFTLESTTNLTSAIWTPVNITPTETDGTSQVVIPTAEQFQFFRLRK